MVATAFHKGYYQFRLCENNVPQKGKDASIAVTQDCFDKNILKSPKNDTKYVYDAQKSHMLTELIEHILTDGIPYDVSCCQPLAHEGTTPKDYNAKICFLCQRLLG